MTFFTISINIAMVMGLLPVVGIPLPLVSYGGSSMIVIMLSFGLIQSAHVHKITEFDLNIFVATGPKTEAYKKVLREEIEAQSLGYNIIEDVSQRHEVNAIIYADDNDIYDFSIFPDDAVIFSIFALKHS